MSQALTFRHGAHPDDAKDRTNGLQIVRMPFVDEYVLPLAQHIGAPAKPVVAPGESVERGQLIAEAAGHVSTALHAPVTGTVQAIELRPHPSGKRSLSIVLETDPYADQRLAQPSNTKGEVPAPKELIRQIQAAGIVGLGGAAFPAHVKLAVPEGKRVRFVILNGCECEPYLTCDHRVMVEHAAEVMRGLEIIMQAVQAPQGYIGVESNKLDAVEALRAVAPPDGSVEVVALEVKYPQGAEKMLIDAIFKKEIPSGGLPLDLEMLVQNVGTAAAIADWVDQGHPLIERVVTVTGPGVRRPANFLVPLGTPVQALLEQAGGLLPNTRQVVMGGPMMGQAQKQLDIPVIKGTSGILALTHSVAELSEEPCIRCGRCLEACPIFLSPARLALLARAEDTEGLSAHHIQDCFECASCSYVCPSRIPLVQLMRVGKALVRQKKAAG